MISIASITADVTNINKKLLPVEVITSDVHTPHYRQIPSLVINLFIILAMLFNLIYIITLMNRLTLISKLEEKEKEYSSINDTLLKNKVIALCFRNKKVWKILSYFLIVLYLFASRTDNALYDITFISICLLACVCGSLSTLFFKCVDSSFIDKKFDNNLTIIVQSPNSDASFKIIKRTKLSFQSNGHIKSSKKSYWISILHNEKRTVFSLDHGLSIFFSSTLFVLLFIRLFASKLDFRTNNSGKSLAIIFTILFLIKLIVLILSNKCASNPRIKEIISFFNKTEILKSAVKIILFLISLSINYFFFWYCLQFKFYLNTVEYYVLLSLIIVYFMSQIINPSFLIVVEKTIPKYVFEYFSVTLKVLLLLTLIVIEIVQWKVKPINQKIEDVDLS